MAATIRSIEITIPTDPAIASRSGVAPSRRRKRLGFDGAILAALAFGLGAFLLYLGVPRTVAAWASLEAQPALVKLQEGKSPSNGELAAGAAGLKQALAWVPSARRETDLALLEVEQAIRLSVSDDTRMQLLARSEAHLIKGLSANPVNGFAWLRLAVVRELRQAPPRQVAGALAQSLDMAPNVRKLWQPRSIMLFHYWREFTFEELLAMRAQLRTIWAVDPAMRRVLVQASTQAGQLAVLSWALDDNPPSMADVGRLKAAVPLPPRR